MRNSDICSSLIQGVAQSGQQMWKVNYACHSPHLHALQITHIMPNVFHVALKCKKRGKISFVSTIKYAVAFIALIFTELQIAQQNCVGILYTEFYPNS